MEVNMYQRARRIEYCKKKTKVYKGLSKTFTSLPIWQKINK